MVFLKFSYDFRDLAWISRYALWPEKYGISLSHSHFMMKIILEILS